MNRYLVFVFVVAVLAALTGCATSTRAMIGPNGPEAVETYHATPGSTDYSSVVNTGPREMECRAAYKNDPRFLPGDIYQMCRSGGMGMYPGGASMLSAGQQGLVNYPGSAAVVGVPSASAPSGEEYLTKGQGQAMGKVIVKHDKDICELKKSQGKSCKE